jgi:hypothetical protein
MHKKIKINITIITTIFTMLLNGSIGVSHAEQQHHNQQYLNTPAAISGFYSPFNSNANGWIVSEDHLWYIESSNYLTTKGCGIKILGACLASVNHINNYPTLTYEVRLKITGPGWGLVMVRGNPTFRDYRNEWKSGYQFWYDNKGNFRVHKINNYIVNKLKISTTTAIKKGMWNTLKITAIAGKLKYYINGTLVWNMTDYSSLPTGRVGIGFLNPETKIDKLWVDWAKLSTTVSSIDE